MNLSDFVFEPDLAQATTIPARWYTDPALLALEQTRVFGATWQLVGRIEQVQQPGAYFTCQVGD